MWPWFSSGDGMQGRGGQDVNEGRGNGAERKPEDGAQLELGARRAPAVRIDPGPDNILYLTFDDPDRRVNVITAETLRLLDELLDELARATEASAVIARSVKPDCFLAGADLDAIARIRTKTEGREASRLGQRVFAKVETLRLPVIAAVDGACLGGGAEFALACHFRLFSDRRSTRFGFPEVRLGLVPAWGGTQRLPQIVGLRRSLSLVLSGRAIGADEARAIGVADDVFPADIFADQVLAYTRQVIAQNRGPRRAIPKLGGWEAFLERTRVGRSALFARAHEELYARTNGHYPAPPMALNAIRIGVEHGNRAGYAVEARSAGELLIAPISRNLVALHFMREAVRKSRGVADSSVEPLPVRGIGVLGSGVMGGGIAHAAIRAEIPVRLRDVRDEAITQALTHVRALYRREVERGLSPAEVERRLDLIAPTLDVRGFRRSDLVVEAVVEDRDLKMRVLRELEPNVREDCIIASNTSSLSITDLATALWRPSRFVGMHFFNPVDRMPLVEIVRGEQSEDHAVATAFDLAKRLGKTPIVVADRPGFLVNRILMPYLNEACLLLEEGFTVDVIDRAMRNFGMPLGPLELLDEIGLDVAARVAENFRLAYGAPMSALLAAMVAQGRRGRKNGLGFYRTTGSERRVDPEVMAFVDSLPAATGDARGNEAAGFAANLQERLVFPMINEAARCLEGGVVTAAGDVDLGLVLGAGFPPFRGGILRYADTLEVRAVVERMRALADEGRDRYAPAPLLVEMAAEGRTFFAER